LRGLYGMLQEEFTVIRDSISRVNLHRYKQTSMVGRSKARVCGRLFAGITASNSAEGMDVCYL
jgi:hypothetical protein